MHRLVFGVFGCVFACIGFTVIGFMWLSPFGEFHSPPIFFRIAASLIAIPFVAMGSAFAYGAFTGKMFDQQAMLNQLKKHHPGFDSSMDEGPSEPPSRARCSNCAAPLEDGGDVSPSGDVKCKHCGMWYNIYKV